MRVRSGILSTLLLSSSVANAAEHFVIGETFPIAEPDTLQEIKTKAAQTDWQKVMRRKDPTSFSGFQTASLPAATEDRSYLFDPTYTILQDIPDGKGNILYPAGTTINVYAVRQFPGRTIVVNPSVEHFRWLEEIAKPTKLDKVLIAGGSILTARQNYSKYPLYALSDRVIERFGLLAVPTIAQQEGGQLRVQQFFVPTDGASSVASTTSNETVTP